jgi:hypothetical protein
VEVKSGKERFTIQTKPLEVGNGISISEYVIEYPSGKIFSVIQYLNREVVASKQILSHVGSVAGYFPLEIVEQYQVGDTKFRVTSRYSNIRVNSGLTDADF